MIEACLAAGCHYVDTGGETPWVRRVRETLARAVRGGGAAVAPATAYMSATAEAAIRVAQEHAPGIDTVEVLSMFMGMPTYGSTQTIFGQLQWESIYLEENEYVEWPPVTTIEALIPGEFRTRLALPWGGFPHPVWFKDDPRIANVYAFGGLLDRSLMENVVAGQRDYQEKIRPLPPRSSSKCSRRSPTRCRRARRRARTAAASARSTSSRRAAASTRCRSSSHGQGAYLQTGLIQAFAAHHLVFQPPQRGRLRLAVLGVRAPRAAGRARGLRAGAAEGGG